MSNTERANLANKALGAYAKEADEANLRDLLCDLRHFADRTGQDWELQLRIGMDNYRAEVMEDGTDADKAKLTDPAQMARDNGLTAGIALAVGLLERGCSSKEILRDCGITSKKMLREAGVDQFDIDGIGDLLPEEE